MKRLIIVMGGAPSLYRDYFRLFDALEKTPRLTRTHRNTLVYEIGDIRCDFMFCLHPTRDHNYTLLRNLKVRAGEEDVPLPADELVERIGECDFLLFIGLCGALNGNAGDIHLPTEFCQIRFNGPSIRAHEIAEVQASRAVCVDNLLLKGIKGRNARAITTNITLLPDSIENREEGLLSLSKVLSPYGDIVDKESYVIAMSLGEQVPCGFALMASDLLSNKRQMMRQHKFEPDIAQFNTMCLSAITHALRCIQRS